MRKNIMTLLIILIISISCLAVVAADNDTDDDTDKPAIGDEIKDITGQIVPISISGNEIKFSDGFTGFCLDLSKNVPTTKDGFKTAGFEGGKNENTVKLAIIECYKMGKENQIGTVVKKVLNNEKDNEIAAKVLSSSENIGNSAVVKINNTTEATFNFELLKSTDNDVSDCLGYKVSLKKVANDNVLGSPADKKGNSTQSGDNGTAGGTNGTSNETNKTSDNGTNETNNTVVNKNNTVIVNETNTTIVNKENTKVINKTTENPQNATLPQSIMRAAGNPIFLLAIVVIIIAVVAVVMRRKN